ncbi:MAG: 5'-methylthioadenosine/S-adenosylhomocysteine nucleosidase [Aestuariivirga sp.]|uniref:5'-methylthioadenosine/S-adenosylhomocysteine nucleosidase n=1 Tax=Aestuariivirga sp. TaxID=2650926 RepID=UPI00301A6012
MKLLETNGRRYLFVMAVEAEYGPELARRFTPLFTGVGPVEAAASASAALAALAATNRQPDIVVSLGSAGSNSLNQTDVYQVSTVSYRDMDASGIGFAKGLTPFLDIPAELPLHAPLAHVPAKRLSTGANIVSGPAYAAIDADMVDMETFAIARCCMRHNVPLIGLRGISDGAAELNHINDWTQYLHIIDGKLATVVDGLLAG